MVTGFVADYASELEIQYRGDSFKPLPEID